MTYTIRQVSEMTGLPATTLRYYDKEGLLPFLGRSAAGYRVFSEGDLALLQVLECLKSTGMPISEIRKYTEWVREGDSTIGKRREMFLRRKEEVEAQIERLKKMLSVIEYKCEYYRLAEEAGTDKGLHGKTMVPHSDEFLSGGMR